MTSKVLVPRSLFQWIGVLVVASILLGFLIGPKMFFVAGAIILLGFSVAAVQSAIAVRRERPRRKRLSGWLDLLPHTVVLLLVVLLLWIVIREFLRG
jgi:hypothetical protein